MKPQVRSPFTYVGAGALAFAVAVTVKLARNDTAAPARAAESNHPRRALVLATYRGGAVSVDQVEDIIAHKLPETRAELAAPDARAAFLQAVVDYELLYLEAERRGYATHPRVVDAIDVRLAQRLVESRFPRNPSSIERAVIEREYQARIDDYVRKPQRLASQIVVMTREEARALLRELRPNDPAGFAKLAAVRSIDPSTRERGGDLALFFDRKGRAAAGREQLIPEALAEAIYGLERIGDLTRPIPVEGGLVVAMWTAENPGFVMPNEYAERQVRDRLARERQEREVNAFVRELEREFPTKIDAALLHAIALDEAPSSDVPSGSNAAPPDPAAPPVLAEPTP